MAASEPEPSDLQAFATLLQDEGYRALIEPEHNAIRSAAGGLRLSLYFKNENLQARCILDGKDSHVQLRHVNDFNANYRFGKLYLDEDDDIVLEGDFLFDVHRDVAAMLLREIVGILEGLISAMKDMIREANAEAKAEPAAGGAAESST